MRSSYKKTGNTVSCGIYSEGTSCSLSPDANCTLEMENILTKKIFFQNLSTYGAIIVMFTYSILLDRDFTCTCKPPDLKLDCDLYMALPSFLIFVLILWIDETFLRICRYTCCESHTHRFCVSFFPAQS